MRGWSETEEEEKELEEQREEENEKGDSGLWGPSVECLLAARVRSAARSFSCLLGRSLARSLGWLVGRLVS